MASELTEGTYAIMSVGSKKAMDVKGGSDLSGANVQQWTYRASDAQMWTFVTPEESSSSWQIICALTNKCLSAASASSGANVLQQDDNDTSLQRWVVEADQNTTTYDGKTYNTYFMHPQDSETLFVEMQGTSTADGVNVRLNTATGGTNQRWFFLPVKVLKENGTYNILLVSDPEMCVDVAAGSTSNGANIQVWSRNNTVAQVFRIHRHDQSNTVGIIGVKSEKALDVKAGKAEKGTTVQLWGSNDTAAQSWLPVEDGKKKIGDISYPKYELRLQAGSGLCMECAGGKKTKSTDIRIWTRNNTAAQRFIFFPTEVTADDLVAPEEVKPNTFDREGSGEIQVTGLRFKSPYKDFQARYCIREYKKDGTRISDKDEWKNVRDDSVSRDGWGDVWSKTFSAPATAVTNEVSFDFDKTYTLASGTNPTDIVKIEIVFEIRPFDANHGSGYIAHGTTKQSIVKVLQRAEIHVDEMSIFLDKDNNDFGIATTISDSLDQGCQRIRGRLLGEDGLPISEWVSTSEMTVKHMTSGTLRRLPNVGEDITFEFSMLNVDGLTITGSKVFEDFSYGSGVAPFYPTIEYLNDDTCCVLVKSIAHSTDYCIMTIADTDGMKMVNCDLQKIENGIKIWRCVPPLNTNTTFTVIGTNNDSDFGFGTVDALVESHLFIWSWTPFGTNDPYSDSAALIVNSETIPQQTRTFTIDMKFNTPSGRLLPVAFASSIIGVDLSIEGVALDKTANYQALHPLPTNISIDNVYRLVRLGGKGIHPVYRTPYGDWYYVGIENVGISNKDIGRISVTVTQRAVEE